jgi:hypothetical protein
MSWISKGTPVHVCELPSIYASSYNNSENGFVAGDDKTHVYPGALWECDHYACSLTWELTENGTWVKE